MFSSLLDGNSNAWLSYVLIGVLVVVLVVSMILMNRKSKKREQEAQALIDAVKPGNKVKTIGGICGIVVEVNPEEDTFVLETGTESSGKSYMKFVRQAILESDAVVEKAAPANKDAKKDEKNGETAQEAVPAPVEEPFADETAPETVTPAEEPATEEVKVEETAAEAEEPKKKSSKKK